MDERIREHAETLVDWSARIEAGDDVVVSVDEGAHDLAVAVSEVLGERGANLTTVYSSEEVQRAYLRAHDEEFTEDPIHELSLYENSDSVLSRTSADGFLQTTSILIFETCTKQRVDIARVRRKISVATNGQSREHPSRPEQK